MRKLVLTATTLIAGLLAGTADAALQTRSMDALEQEVRARDAALVGDLDPAQKKLKKIYARVLRQFERLPVSRKVDHKRITKVVKVLSGKRTRDDGQLQGLLDQGVSGFMLELDEQLADVRDKLDLLERPVDEAALAESRYDKAGAALQTALDQTSLKRILRKCVRADLFAKKAAHSLDAALVAHGPLDVHRFQYDIATDEYVVVGERIPQAQVLRDLAGSLCTKCHDGAVAELKSSVHYTIAAPSQRVLFPGGGSHGMLDRACGLPATTGLTNSLTDINLGECAKCHTSRYLPIMEPFFAAMFQQMGVVDAQGEATRLVDAGLDCLICHAEHYRSVPEGGILAAISPTAGDGSTSPTAVGFARASRDNSDFDRDGVPDLVIDVDGDGVADAPLMMDTDGDGQPDTPWPTVAQDRSLEALRSIGGPTEHACLRCHEHARTGYKRGTLFIEGHDVHAGATGGIFADAENQCTACHTADHHKFVRGHAVGGDLAAADYPAPPPGVPADPNDPTDLTCETCHSTASLPAAIHTPKHLETISCETCHIPYGSGITYSLFGHGGQVSFGRNDDGKDTKLVVSDMYVGGDRADLDKDYEAYKTLPILSWFDGGTSFLAQPLTVRGMPNSKITPFKPMANGMAFDSRFFSGATETNEAGYDYNAYSMYRFYANGMNAEAFGALGMLDMTPTAVRNVTMNSFFDEDPRVQAMGLMLIFPNLVYFDKGAYGYEHYQTVLGSPFDANGDGIVDAGADFNFDMFAAANSGLRQFQGFNGPLGFAPDYQWYPPFDDVSDVISMKLPDGSLIKMFLQMQAGKLPPEMVDAYMAAVDNYPSFSQITLGGHGVRPKAEAVGSCGSCHSAGGLMSHKVPVGRRVPVDMGPMGTLEFPQYQWRYYNVKGLVDLGLATTSEQIVAGAVDVDIDGNTTFVRESSTAFVLNWFAPNAPDGYRRPDAPTALQGTGLTAENLTWQGGDWMPVLEPIVDYLSNARVLGYDQDWIPMQPE